MSPSLLNSFVKKLQKLSATLREHRERQAAKRFMMKKHSPSKRERKRVLVESQFHQMYDSQVTSGYDPELDVDIQAIPESLSPTMLFVASEMQHEPPVIEKFAEMEPENSEKHSVTITTTSTLRRSESIGSLSSVESDMDLSKEDPSIYNAYPVEGYMPEYGAFDEFGWYSTNTSPKFGKATSTARLIFQQLTF